MGEIWIEFVFFYTDFAVQPPFRQATAICRQLRRCNQSSAWPVTKQSRDEPREAAPRGEDQTGTTKGGRDGYR